MNMLYVFAIILSVAVVAWGSPAKQCENENFEGLTERISIDPCGKTKCNLPKEQNTTVVFKFKPEKEVKQLWNTVYAKISGVPLPFIGVDSTNACNDVYHAEDKTPAPCPLEAGKEYVYTNVFYVHSFYPEVPMIVHWSLDDSDTKVICFEIKAAIVKRPNRKN